MGLVTPRHVGSSLIRSNPCLLHWQPDSLPLIHQGKPIGAFKCVFSPVPTLEPPPPSWGVLKQGVQCRLSACVGHSGGPSCLHCTACASTCNCVPWLSCSLSSKYSSPFTVSHRPRSPPHSFPLWSHTRGQAGPHVYTQHALGCELGWKGCSQCSGLLLMRSVSQHQPRHCHPTRLALGLGSLWIPNLCLLLSSSCPRSNTP